MDKLDPADTDEENEAGVTKTVTMEPENVEVTDTNQSSVGIEQSSNKGAPNGKNPTESSDFPVDSGTGAFHSVEEDAKKDSYETEFEKFLHQAGREDTPVSDIQTEAENGEDKKESDVINNVYEESSNSSWYKMKELPVEKMDTTESESVMIPPDECSNLSVPDNHSVASSNIGDSCMSFQDQGMDECSNSSMPGDNSVPAYTGHQPVFDESANMNPPSNVPFLRPDTPSRADTPTRPDTPSRADTPSRPDTPSSTNDATSESTPVKRYRRGTLQIAAEDASEHGHGITAADIFEYQWPQEKDSEYFMLQEQISMYLDVKSFKRKYPDLFRRVCDKQEKDFLREKGVVSETQSDLGLTALKADEVHDLMGKDYPAKYKEFLKILREREKQKMADKMKEFHNLKLEKDKMIEYTKKAMKSVSDWNRNLLKVKNEQRRAYFDMQTFTIQYPRGKFRKLESSQTEVSSYPLTLIPGQFQDYYRKYSSEELKYFPLNTSIFDPPKKVDITEDNDDENDSQAEEKGIDSGSDSDDSSSSSSDDDDDDDNDDNKNEDGDLKKERSSSREVSQEKSEVDIKFENECRICKDESLEKQKETQHEELIVCSECKTKGHPTCLDLNDDMVKVIKTYPWQCMECKTCIQCMDPYDEDKMLFCDKCDRGYHTFCVGLKSLPTGQWDCFSCRGDTTPIKPLPRPTPKSKRGRKPGRPPGRVGRPPGRPPKDPNKIQETPVRENIYQIKRETPARERRRYRDRDLVNQEESNAETASKDDVKDTDVDSDVKDGQVTETQDEMEVDQTVDNNEENTDKLNVEG
ncbi:PHD finger protein 10 [Mactra antiquata]